MGLLDIQYTHEFANHNTNSFKISIIHDIFTVHDNVLFLWSPVTGYPS